VKKQNQSMNHIVPGHLYPSGRRRLRNILQQTLSPSCGINPEAGPGTVCAGDSL
jgi:hypothetical protein